MRTKAFTLIELLIVVAIIAILAAIAVPNFLEAQTRSKVSRARADLRSLATALEAYRVDENSYPPSVDGGGINPIEQRWRFITTPIAYITAIPDDVFGDNDVEISDFNTNPTKYRTFDFVTFDKLDNTNFEIRFRNDLVANGFSEATQWYAASQGPDLTPGLAVLAPAGLTAKPGFSPLSGRATGLPYDPTNGTISDGDIIRVSGGQVE